MRFKYLIAAASMAFALNVPLNAVQAAPEDDGIVSHSIDHVYSRRGRTFIRGWVKTKSGQPAALHIYTNKGFRKADSCNHQRNDLSRLGFGNVACVSYFRNPHGLNRVSIAAIDPATPHKHQWVWNAPHAPAINSRIIYDSSVTDLQKRGFERAIDWYEDRGLPFRGKGRTRVTTKSFAENSGSLAYASGYADLRTQNIYVNSQWAGSINENFIYLLALHEIGHMIGLPHIDGTFMQEEFLRMPSPNDIRFVESHLACVMNGRQPYLCN
jgi:hypothetical protein